MEFRRIFFNRKIILISILFLIINCGMFVFEQTNRILDEGVSIFSVAKKVKELSNEYKNMYVQEAYELNQKRIYENDFFGMLNICNDEDDEYYDFYKEREVELRQENPELAEIYENNKDLFSSTYCNLQTYSLKTVNEILEYQLNYQTKFEKIDKNIDMMNQIAAMQSDYATKDAEKTLNNYDRIRNIELTFDDYSGIEAILNFKVPIILSFILLMAIILLLLEDRKEGLFEVVRTTKNGRGKLAIKRIGILLFASAFYPGVMYFSLLPIVLRIYRGVGDLSANIQSSTLFDDVTYPISFGKFTALNILIIIIAVFALALFIWCILSLLKSIRLATLSVVAFTVWQWVSYAYIPQQNIFAAFKYANFISGLNLVYDLREYSNIPINSFVVNKSVVTFAFLLVAIILFSCICFITAHKNIRIKNGKNILLIKKYLLKTKNNILCKGSLAFKELNKVLVCQKGLALIILLITILLWNADFEPINYSASEGIVNEFYDVYAGETASQAKGYLLDLEKQISGVTENISLSVTGIKHLTTAYSEISSYIEYLEETEKIGYDVKVVNPVAYEHLLADGYYKEQIVYDVLAIIFLILLLSDIYTFETKNNMAFVLLSTPKGRGKLFKSKVLSSIILAVIVWIFVYGTAIFNIHYLFGFQDSNVSMQSIQAFSSFGFKLTIGEFVVLSLILKLAILIGISIFICLISACLKREASVVMISFFLLAFPEILIYSGLNFLRGLSVISFLNSPMHFIGNIIGILVLLFALVLLILRKNKKEILYGYFT